MKKLTLFLLIILLSLGLLYKYNISLTPKQTITKEEQVILKEVKVDQERIEYLKKLQNPLYIEGSLKQVGKLITLEGDYQYSDIIKESGIMDVTLREIILDMNYTYGLGIDLQYIRVSKVIDDTVIIQIPKDKIQLLYVQLDTNKSKIILGKKMFLFNQFQPDDVEVIIEQSQLKVANLICNDKRLHDLAMISLKAGLERRIGELGYKQIIFEEV